VLHAIEDVYVDNLVELGVARLAAILVELAAQTGGETIAAYIALVPEEERSRPDGGAEIVRRLLAAGRASEADGARSR
jgi:hypothetical protein